LTSSGDIYLWYPFSDEYITSLTPDNELNGPLTNTTTTSTREEQSTRELKWGKVGSVVRLLETIPARPELEVGEELKEMKEAKDEEWRNWQVNLTDKTIEEGRKVVKIASGADFLLALRASGEVWACSVSQNTLGEWIYVRPLPSPFVTFSIT
jgi:SCF-associated factor 1